MIGKLLAHAYKGFSDGKSYQISADVEQQE